MFKVIENFLDKEIFKKVKEEVFTIPWYYSKSTGTEKDYSSDLFYHLLYRNKKVESEHYFNSILMPVLGKLNFNYLNRAKLNLYTKRDKHIKTSFHIDNSEPHTVALFSFNTNNGYTEFENKTKVQSKENTLTLFLGHVAHRSVNQTDERTRINLNINLQNVF
jgi:hypothetical protein